VAHQALMVPEQALAPTGQKYVYVVNDQNEVDTAGRRRLDARGVRVVVPEKMVRGQDGQVRPAQRRAGPGGGQPDAEGPRGGARLQRVRPGGRRCSRKVVPMPVRTTAAVARTPAVVGQVSDASEKRSAADASPKRR